MTPGDGRFLAGVELGGTKAIAVLWRDGAIVERATVPTTTPAATLGAVRAQLDRWHAVLPLAGLGIASFGPVRLAADSDDFGSILATPKPGWAGARVVEVLGDGLGCPVAIDTDVNAAALAEARWGAGRDCSSLVYLTIGTGIGGGVVVEGRPVHGRLHPEIGHVLTRRAASDDFAGTCLFHGDCIEGLVSGPALERRLGATADRVPSDAPGWGHAAHDLAQLLALLIHTTSPQRILVGGGVGLGAPWLLERARALLPGLLGGYYPDLDAAALAEMIGHPELGADAGPLGAIALALNAAL